MLCSAFLPRKRTSPADSGLGQFFAVALYDLELTTHFHSSFKNRPDDQVNSPFLPWIICRWLTVCCFTFGQLHRRPIFTGRAHWSQKTWWNQSDAFYFHVLLNFEWYIQYMGNCIGWNRVKVQPEKMKMSSRFSFGCRLFWAEIRGKWKKQATVTKLWISLKIKVVSHDGSIKKQKNR